jgi:hypothetical protein
MMERRFLVIAIQLLYVPVTSAAVIEGQFTLYATDPGSLPLNVPFSGTFTFDDSVSHPIFWGGGAFYNISVISATLTGGDLGDACCYVFDPLTGFPQITYLREGEPWSVNLFFRNATLNSTVNLVGPNEGYPQNHPDYGLHWAEAIRVSPDSTLGIRGGVFTFTAPPLPSIPEPSALVACVAVSFIVATLYRFSRRDE